MHEAFPTNPDELSLYSRIDQWLQHRNRFPGAASRVRCNTRYIRSAAFRLRRRVRGGIVRSGER